jgi:hypothetical protein
MDGMCEKAGCNREATHMWQDLDPVQPPVYVCERHMEEMFRIREIGSDEVKLWLQSCDTRTRQALPASTRLAKSW